MKFKCLCQDCLAVFESDDKNEVQERHEEKIMCGCGGQFCACGSCMAMIEQLSVPDLF